LWGGSPHCSPFDSVARLFLQVSIAVVMVLGCGGVHTGFYLYRVFKPRPLLFDLTKHTSHYPIFSRTFLALNIGAYDWRSQGICDSSSSLLLLSEQEH
jgi:hypothetical protein